MRTTERIAAVLLVGGVLAFMPSRVMGEGVERRWMPIGRSQFIDAAIDLKTMGYSGNDQAVWVRQIHWRDPAIERTLDRWAVNCRERTVKVIQFIEYRRDGSLFESEGSDAEPTHPVPDSAGERVIEFICDEDASPSVSIKPLGDTHAVRTEPTKRADLAVSKVEKRLTDAKIRRRMIDESVAAYRAFRGNCPCPYNLARNGSICGNRSAWSRPGGEEPLCYSADITAEMVQQYRDRHRAGD